MESHYLGNALAVSSTAQRLCRCFTAIHLALQADSGQQGSAVAELKESLSAQGVTLDVQYSSTIHDREIRYSWHMKDFEPTQYTVIVALFYGSNPKLIVFRFNNGWIIKIGRGLDYFKRPKVRLQTNIQPFLLLPLSEFSMVQIYE